MPAKSNLARLPLVTAGLCAVAGLAGSAWSLLPAAAAQLDKEACDALKEESVLLVQAGARASMMRGPDWGKANLPPDKLNQVARLIEVEQHIQFRCPQPKPPLERAEKEAPAKAKAVEAEIKAKPKLSAAAGSPPAAKAATAPPSAAGSAPLPKLKGSLYPADKAVGATAKPAAGTQAAAEPKPKPKPRPKANDAFSPSASGTTSGAGLDAQATDAVQPRARSTAPAQRSTTAPARTVE